MAAPQGVRTSYRVARHLFETLPPCHDLPRELVDGCEVCASRLDMLDRLPKGGTVAELGTYRGDFARQILERNAPRQLHLVDIAFSWLDASLRKDPRITCHEGLTHNVIAGFSDGHFDWIYVDADHAYASTLRDAKASAAKLRPGGLLAFNDFGHMDRWLGHYGVHRAVVDFALEYRWKMRYFAMNAEALYDVVLEKPSP